VSDKPFIVFSSPGMLHTGNSLKIFKALCEDEKNLVIIPGYCMKNTLAEMLLNGTRTVTLEREYTIKMQVRNIGFSAHADSSSILRFIAKIRPRNVVLVHGDKNRMAKFKRIIERMCSDMEGFDFRCNVFMPRNKCLVDLPGRNEIVLKSAKEINEDEIAIDTEQEGSAVIAKRIRKYVVRK
ncbi:putative cleavage and polyadenylation specificity factor (CPSF subunit), partial [Trachipleistophora hominis]